MPTCPYCNSCPPCPPCPPCPNPSPMRRCNYRNPHGERNRSTDVTSLPNFDPGFNALLPPEETVEFDDGQPLFNPGSQNRLRELTDDTSPDITMSEESLDAVVSAVADAERDQHLRPNNPLLNNIVIPDITGSRAAGFFRRPARGPSTFQRSNNLRDQVSQANQRRLAGISAVDRRVRNNANRNEENEITMSRDAFRNTISAVMDSEMAQASALGRRQREEEPDNGARGVDVFDDDASFGPREDDDSF